MVTWSYTPKSLEPWVVTEGRLQHGGHHFATRSENTLLWGSCVYILTIKVDCLFLQFYLIFPQCMGNIQVWPQMNNQFLWWILNLFHVVEQQWILVFGFIVVHQYYLNFSKAWFLDVSSLTLDHSTMFSCQFKQRVSSPTSLQGSVDQALEAKGTWSSTWILIPTFIIEMMHKFQMCEVRFCFFLVLSDSFGHCKLYYLTYIIKARKLTVTTKLDLISWACYCKFFSDNPLRANSDVVSNLS